VNGAPLGTTVAAKLGRSGDTASNTTYQFAKTTRTLDAAIGDLASVLLLGAVNDGKTDCTAFFHALMAAGGGEYYIPAGNYLITDNGILMSTSLRFTGPGNFIYGASIIPAGRFISSNLTLLVPDVFPQPNNAYGYLNGRHLGDGVTVTIHIPDGTYSGWATTFPGHPQGNRIQIIGDVANRDNVNIQINLTNAGKFLMATNGNGIGLINGLTITGLNGWQSQGVWNESISPWGAAVWADNGGFASIGSAIHVNKMYYGFRADHSGCILISPNVLVEQYGDVGYHAYGGGTVFADRTFAGAGGHVSQLLGAGYIAEFGGHMQAEQASSSGANLYGMGALSNGSTWAQGCTITGAGQYGAWAENGGHMIALQVSNEPVSITSCKIGVRGGKGGTVEAGGAIVSGSTQDGVNCNAGRIDFTNGTSKNNGGSGVIARYCGVIYGLNYVSGTANGNKIKDIQDSTSVIGADPTL